MRYPFPAAVHLDEYLPAIAGRDEFVVRTDPQAGITTINYLFATDTTFADPMACADAAASRLAALRRECRGLSFDSTTGRVVARKYHIFHNVGERPEYAARHRLDTSALDAGEARRIDGDAVPAPQWRAHAAHPHRRDARRRTGRAVRRAKPDSDDPFNARLRTPDSTPLYEWCSHHQRIILDYPTDRPA